MESDHIAKKNTSFLEITTYSREMLKNTSYLAIIADPFHLEVLSLDHQASSVSSGKSLDFFWIVQTCM